MRDADGTAFFSCSEEPTEAMRFMQGKCEEHRKPFIHIAGRGAGANGGVSMLADSAAQLQRFVVQHRVRVLNVSGPRASREPSVGAFVSAALDAAFGTRAPVSVPVHYSPAAPAPVPASAPASAPAPDGFDDWALSDDVLAAALDAATTHQAT